MVNKEKVLHKLMKVQSDVFKLKEDFKSYEIKNFLAGDYVINIKIEKRK